MKAEIIASGTELLLGEISDVNTSFIASQMASLGIDVYYASIVGDNHQRFLEVLQRAQQRSDIIVITGGLGPTKGDITREVVANLMNEEMTVDNSVKEQIAAYFKRIGVEMPVNNIKQATVIPSAAPIPNPIGTAPGWWVEKYGKIVVLLPGPPSEMHLMWEKQVRPRLEGRGSSIIKSRILKTWGISEAGIDQMVGKYMYESSPTLALYAKADGIHLRITAKAAGEYEAMDIISRREAELRDILKDNIWGIDNESLEGIIGKLLIEKKLTVGTLESFTGGYLSGILCGVPEHTEFYRGGMVIADTATREMMGISASRSSTQPGLDSAMRMAVLARENFSADIGIGIDGFITHEDNIPSSKAYIAVNCGTAEENSHREFPGRPMNMIRRTSMQALFDLRKTLLSL